MKLMDTLDRKLGSLAICNLMLYIVLEISLYSHVHLNTDFVRS